MVKNTSPWEDLQTVRHQKAAFTNAIGFSRPGSRCCLGKPLSCWLGPQAASPSGLSQELYGIVLAEGGTFQRQMLLSAAFGALAPLLPGERREQALR